MTGVYQIRNLITGRVYIGSATSLRARRNCHFSALRGGCHYNRRLQNSWNKHGEQSFAFEPLEVGIDAAGVVDAEQRWIDRAAAEGRSLYNARMVASSNIGLHHSDEVRARLSAKFKGRRLTELQKARISAARTGQRSGPRPDAVKAKISRTRLGIEPWNKGQPYTPRPASQGRRIGGAVIWANKTHCAQGHLFDEANTYVAPSGRRGCRACTRERMRERRTVARIKRGVEGTHEK